MNDTMPDWLRLTVSLDDHYDLNPNPSMTNLTATLNHLRRVPELSPHHRVRILLRAAEALQRMAAEETKEQVRANQVNRRAGWNLSQAAEIWGITRQAMSLRWKRWVR